MGAMSEPRLPPFSGPSENALIGAILQRYDTALDAATERGITSESFYLRENALVWDAIMELDSKGVPIDAITVMDELRQSGAWNETVDGSYLDLCIESAITPSRADNYAKIVKEKELRRAVIDAGRQAVDEAYSDDDGCEDRALRVMTEVSARLAGLNGTSCSHLPQLIDMAEASWRKAEVDGFDGVPTRFFPLARIIGGYRYGELSVVAGYRGEGKSLWMGNEITFAATSGIPTLCVSLEMPKERIAGRILGEVGDFSTFKMDMAKAVERDWEKVQEGREKLKGLPLWIEDGSRDLDEVLRMIRYHVAKNHVRNVWIDYLQLMHIAGFRQSRNYEVGKISGALVDLAKKHRIALIALSQFSRDPDKADRRPKLSDLRDSGSIEQDARMVILIAKDPESEPVERNLPGGGTHKDWRYIAEVAKHNAGPLGEVPMHRESARQRWVPEEQHEAEGEGPLF